MRNPFSRAAWSWRALPAIAAGVLVLRVAKPSGHGIALGLPLVGAGEALRIWAAGHLHKTRELTISGPYARLRHPMYAGTLLIATALCLMADGLVAAVAIPLLFVFFFAYYFPYKEAPRGRRLGRRHGEAFSAYRAGVRALIPRATPWRPSVGHGKPTHWSARRVRDNDEVGTAALVVLPRRGRFSCARFLDRLRRPLSRARTSTQRFWTPRLPRRVAAAQRDDFLTDLPKISTHEHYREGGAFDAYRKVAAELGIRKVILLPTGEAPDNRGYREHMASLLELARQQPDFVVPFATVNPPDADAVALLEDAVRKGARGLKLMSGHPDFYRAPLDAPPMLALLEAARRLRIPVLMHVSPVRFPKQLPELEHLLAAFPEVTVVAAHYARMTSDLGAASRLLDTYPNLFMDVSMGRGLPRYQGEIARWLREYRAFILAHQDRLLWGTDLVLGKRSEAFIRARIRTDFLLLGTKLYVDPQSGGEPRAVEVGLDLPRDVLEGIFSRNPERILGIRID